MELKPTNVRNSLKEETCNPMVLVYNDMNDIAYIITINERNVTVEMKIVSKYFVNLLIFINIWISFIY